MEWTNKSVEDRGGGIVVSMIAFYSYDSSSNLPDTFIFSVKCCLKRTKMSPGLANLKEKKKGQQLKKIVSLVSKKNIWFATFSQCTCVWGQQKRLIILSRIVLFFFSCDHDVCPNVGLPKRIVGKQTQTQAQGKRVWLTRSKNSFGSRRVGWFVVTDKTIKIEFYIFYQLGPTPA